MSSRDWSERFEELFLAGTLEAVNRISGFDGHKGCKEFVRLKDIRQQGYGHLKYPGLTNTRYKHSVFTFLNSIKYIERIEEIFSQASGPLYGASYDRRKATVTVLAALLHDIGQTSPGHFWEKVKTASDQHRTHEEWSAVIIESPETEVHQALERLGRGIAQEVADTIRTEAPRDFWDMVVSSEFDADRWSNVYADGLMMMSSKDGPRKHPYPLDLDALLKHVEIRPLPASDQDKIGQKPVLGFVIRQEGIRHIENLLVGRKEVYWAVSYNELKVGMEAKLLELLELVREAFQDGRGQQTNIPADHPAVAYLTKRDISVKDYLGLTDTARQQMIDFATKATDSKIRKVALEMEAKQGFNYIDVTGLKETERKELVASINEGLVRIGASALDETEAATSICFNCYPGSEKKVPSSKRVWMLGADESLRDAADVSNRISDLAWGQRTDALQFADKALYEAGREAYKRWNAPKPPHFSMP